MYSCVIHVCLLLFITESVAEINLCPDENSLKDYNGTISITNGGRTCQRWSSNTPHAHSYTSPDFPGDSSIESAENYCRGIDGAAPFCLTNDPHVRGQNCDERICGGATCGGVRTDSEGELRSLDSDDNGYYDNRTDCLWTLTAPEGQHILFQIISMDIEDEYACAFDFLEVYEMISDTFFSHGRYCGVTLSNMTSRGSTLHVRFYSDDYGEGPGFVAKYSHVDADDTVPTEDNSPYSIGKLLCPRDVDIGLYSGTVNVTNGGRVCQAWDSLVPHWHPYIDIMFQVDGSRKEAHNYCRNIADQPIPWCITVDESKFFEPCHEHICAGAPCGGLVTEPGGWLRGNDREEDGFFDIYQDCLWELQAPEDKVLEVTVYDVFIDTMFDPYCDYVSLMLYKKSFEKVVCVNDTLPMMFIPASNSLFVRFVANVNGPGPGFNLSYNFFTPIQVTSTTSTLSFNLSQTTVLETITQGETTPGYSGSQEPEGSTISSSDRFAPAIVTCAMALMCFIAGQNF